MGQDNYRFRYEAYKNNTFDLDDVEKSLDESKMSAYQYLRQFQLDSTGYKRFDFEMQEIYRTYNINHVISMVPRRWVFFIEHEFINVGKRLDYKRSQLYEKDLTFTDIINRPDLFDSTFLVFVNGKLYTKGVKLLCKEDKTYMIFLCKEDPSPEGFGMLEMKEYIETNAKVSIYFIPNTGIKTISTNAYRVRSLNNSKGIPTRNLGLTDFVDYNNSLSYITHVDDIVSLPTTINFLDNGLYVNNRAIDEVINQNPTNTAIDIQLIPLRNLLMKIEVEGTKWFEIPLQDYPVAVENCIIVDEDGFFVHDARINHYYPNIYSIENVDELLEEKKVFVYVFYFENKLNKLKHLDILYAYHKYVPDYLERYKNGLIPTLVKDYDPPIVDYSIKNYRKGLEFNESIEATYLRSSDGNIYKISIVDNRLQTEVYDSEEAVFAPDCFYVLDTMIDQKFKLYMIDDILYTEPTNESNAVDTVYIYDKVAEMHNNLGTENGVLALFEYIHYSDHFKYKIIKMKEFIKADVNNFRRYLRNLGLGNNYYYVNVAKIDLEQRRRIDNHDTKSRRFKTFNKEMYMFVFRNDFRGMYDELVIHVDGTRYEREVQVYQTNMLDYVYIPCELVKPDSVIEIEKVTDVKKDIIFRSDSTAKIVKIDITEFAVRNKTLFNDLFVVDRETGEYVDPHAYQIILPVKFHMDDIESDIVIDYIITETDAGYYQLAALERGVIEVYQDDDLDNIDNAFFLSLQDDKHDFYQFDIGNNRPSFNKVDAVSGYVINKIRSMTDKNLIYQFKMVDGSIKMEISEDDGTGKQLAEGGLNLVDIEDVFLQCPREIKIRVLDKAYLNKDLTLHIKKHHNITFVDGDVPEGSEIDLSFYPIPVKTTAKKDPRYFRIYQNGRLVPRHLGNVHFHEYTLTSDVHICPGFLRDPGAEYNIAIECMPYMMKQVCYLETIPRDKVINLKGLIDKPFDFRWYDIYINGKKLVRKEVEIVSANLIKLLKTDSLHSLEIIENSRDKEYFGGFEDGVYDIIDELYKDDETFRDNLDDSVANNDDINDTEIPVVEIPVTPLDFILRAYYDYMVENLGFINPDWLQISRDEIKYFSPLISEYDPFGLGFDIYGANRDDVEIKIPLPINPDE